MQERGEETVKKSIEYYQTETKTYFHNEQTLLNKRKTQINGAKNVKANAQKCRIGKEK